MSELGGLKDLLNALFSHPDDPNLMCVVNYSRFEVFLFLHTANTLNGTV